MKFNQLTTVITTFKSENKIFKCLSSLRNSCKVIVVENSNNHILKKNIERKFKNTICYLSQKNLGYAKGNNLGLSKVKTRYALILNPDTLVKGDTIKNFFKIIKKIKNFAILAPLRENYNKKNFNKKKGFMEVNSVKGFAMFFNLKEFKKIGYFDKNFFIYLEEIDLCRRLKRNNKKIYLHSDLKIDHYGGRSHDSSVAYQMELSRNWHWMWSIFYFNKKHYGFLYALLIILPKLLSAIIKLLFFLIIFNKKKLLISYQRISGIVNSILNNKSWYRPKFK